MVVASTERGLIRVRTRGALGTRGLAHNAGVAIHRGRPFRLEVPSTARETPTSDEFPTIAVPTIAWPTIARAASSGFTLIEMMIAMGILVVGVSSVLGLLAFGAALQRTAERRGETSLAAEQVVADLRDSFVLQKDGSVSGPPSLTMDRDIEGHPTLKAHIELKKTPPR